MRQALIAAGRRQALIAAGRRQALIVAGPTCSGKSALALLLAQRYGGTVINADSMQVYRELHLLTARPSAADEAAAPHRLYGIRPASEPGSVAWWRTEALAAMAGATLPILCGGTGMYLQSMTAGLADIPEPDPAARDEARDLVDREGSAALHARLIEVDPETAAGLSPSDGQRIARAWEVWRSTGLGLTAWQRRSGAAAPYDFMVIQIAPPRDALRAAAEARFDGMLAAGALAEVSALLALGLDPALPAMRAHGVTELGAHLRGEVDLASARQRAISATQQYLKRQATWFGNRALVDPAMTRIIQALFRDQTQLSKSDWQNIDTFVSKAG